MILAPGRLLIPAAAARSAGPPSLDLNFLEGLPGGLTFTRASTAWAYNSSGVLSSFATNAPRIDYDPATLAPKGLLIEEARTNLFLNSATGATQSVTVTAAAHTLSFFGTGTITLTGTSTAGPLVGTGASNRVSLTFTPTAGSLTLTVSGSVTNAQLELGAFASSPIVTTGSAVARAADVCTLATLPPWHNATAGTLVGEATAPAVAAVLQMLCQLDDGTTTTNRVSLQYNDGTGASRAITSSGGSNVLNALLGTVSAGAVARIAAAYAAADFAATGAGAGLLAATSGAVPASISQLRLGHRGAGYLNGHLRRVRFWPVRLPNDILQAIVR